MARGSIFEVLQYLCFKYTNISGELMLCINFLLVLYMYLTVNWRTHSFRMFSRHTCSSVCLFHNDSVNQIIIFFVLVYLRHYFIILCNDQRQDS